MYRGSGYSVSVAAVAEADGWVYRRGPEERQIQVFAVTMNGDDGSSDDGRLGIDEGQIP